MSALYPTMDERFRSSVVGASEVAALFDANPYLTRFEVWHRKAGNIATPDFNAVGPDGTPENMRIYCGVKLERVVVEIACEIWGYQPIDTPERLDNGAGLGGHPDQLVICPERGPGILEVKTADRLVAKKWGDEPPLHYLLQAQTYAGLAGVQWADIITLVGGNEPRRHREQARPALYADIERRVAEFWASVRAGTPPAPDYARDGRALVEVLGEPTEEVADLRHDFDADMTAFDFLRAKADAKAAEQRAEEARNKLLHRIGTAGVALLPNTRIAANQTKGSPGTLITADHVGTTIGARKGYRRFDVKELQQ